MQESVSSPPGEIFHCLHRHPGEVFAAIARRVIPFLGVHVTALEMIQNYPD
jgi:hypothetical protein